MTASASLSVDLVKEIGWDVSESHPRSQQEFGSLFLEGVSWGAGTVEPGQKLCL
jgi:hypothetical protein